MSQTPCPNPEIVAADWHLTPPGVQQFVLELSARLSAVVQHVTQLEAEVVRLREENAHLREQKQSNSQNSSRPPSSDPPSGRVRPLRHRSGKHRGGQPGHRGHERQLVPVEACAEVFAHRPTQCSTCGQALSGDDPQPGRHQVVEIPPVKPIVTEHRLHQLACAACGATTRAPLPAEVAATGYGPRVVATVAVLSSVLRASQRRTQAALADLWQVEVALGTVHTLRQEASAAVAEPVAEATSYAQEQEVAHADETSWVQGNADGANPTQRTAWLWVLVTMWVTVFQVKVSRGQAAARELLGAYSGCLVTDRWSGYRWWPLEKRQVCWAHLLRDFHKIAERGDESQRIGEGLLEQARALFALWQRVRDGTLRRADFALAVEPIQQRVYAWVSEGAAYRPARGEKSTRARTARTCQELLKVELALWLFVRVEGVEPTNNAAERALRQAVLWRRTSFGTQSAEGSAFVARMLTVIETLRAQERNVVAYLTHACAAARQGEPAPSLLPQLSLSQADTHSIPLAA